MTVFKLMKGTLVTFDGVPARVLERCTQPTGYWLQPINDPTMRLPVCDRDIESGLEGKGRFRMGVPERSLPDADPALGLPEAEALSQTDMLVRDYRYRLACEIDRMLSLPHGQRPGRREAGRLATSSVEPPSGVKRLTGKTALGHYDRLRLAGDREALAPMTATKGNREQRKPDFVLDAIEEALDQRYSGNGSLPRVQELAIQIAQRSMPADLTPYVRHVRRKGGTMEAVSLIDRDDDGEVDWERLVSLPTIRRAKNRRSAVFRAIREIGPEEAKEAFATSLAAPMVTQPLEASETDSFALNGLFVIDDENWFPLGFPWATVLIDSATRSCLGLDVEFQSADSDSVLRCLHQAFSPKDLSGYRFDDGRPVFTRRWTQFGKLRLVKTDLGSPFISGHTRDLIYRIGSNLLPLKPRRPRLKPKVERFIKTVKYGSVGVELGILPRRLRKQAATGQVLVISLRQLKLLLTHWIVEIYHQEVHGSLGMSPQEAWDTMTARMPVDPPPPQADLDLLVGKYGTATLNRNGIRTLNLEYNSPEFGALRAHAADPDGTMKVEFKYNSANIDTIQVLAQDPVYPDRVVAVPGYCKQMAYARGLSEYRHSVIQAYAKEAAKGRKVTVHQLFEAKQKLAELARTMFREQKSKFGTINVGRYLNAGRSYLLSATELPEDDPDSGRHLDLVDARFTDEDAERSPKVTPTAPLEPRVEDLVDDNPGPDTAMAVDVEGRHVRRKLGTLRHG